MFGLRPPELVIVAVFIITCVVLAKTIRQKWE